MSISPRIVLLLVIVASCRCASVKQHGMAREIGTYRKHFVLKEIIDQPIQLPFCRFILEQTWICMGLCYPYCSLHC